MTPKWFYLYHPPLFEVYAENSDTETNVNAQKGNLLQLQCRFKAKVWISFKGTSGAKPSQQNTPCIITEPPDPLTVGVKLSGLCCSPGVPTHALAHLSRIWWSMTHLAISLFFHISVNLRLWFFAPLNSQMCINLYNKGFIRCSQLYYPFMCNCQKKHRLCYYSSCPPCAVCNSYYTRIFFLFPPWFNIRNSEACSVCTHI